MIFPTQDNIMEALELLKKMGTVARQAQLAELRSAQPDGLDDNMAFGYELGLATARAIIAINPEVRMAGLHPERIL